MNILLINQPLNNRGDEAAHKALVRTLSKDYSDSHIEVLFIDANLIVWSNLRFLQQILNI